MRRNQFQMGKSFKCQKKKKCQKYHKMKAWKKNSLKLCNEEGFSDYDSK